MAQRNAFCSAHPPTPACVNLSVVPAGVYAPNKKHQVERLQGSMMSGEERESLQSDLETARLNIKETERMLEVATERNADLEEEIRAMRGETEGYTAKVCARVAAVKP